MQMNRPSCAYFGVPSGWDATTPSLGDGLQRALRNSSWDVMLVTHTSLPNPSVGLVSMHPLVLGEKKPWYHKPLVI